MVIHQPRLHKDLALLNNFMNVRFIGLQLGLTKSASGVFKALSALPGKLGGNAAVQALAKTFRNSGAPGQQLVGHALEGNLYGGATRGGQALGDNLLNMFSNVNKARVPAQTGFASHLGLANSLDPRMLGQAPLVQDMTNRAALKGVYPEFTKEIQNALKGLNNAARVQ